MARPAKTALEIELRQWLRRNRKENSRLEFKLRLELGSAGAKAEFIRDVLSLANSEGEAPREDGHLVIGFKNGKLHDIRGDRYDGATFGQILDSYIFPPISTLYEEFDNGADGRVGVLVVRPDPGALYVVYKTLQEPNRVSLLAPGQCWARRSDRKVELSGEDIHERIATMTSRMIEAATAPLLQRISKLEYEAGPALEVKRIRFAMEATRKWPDLEEYLDKLLPYAREFDNPIKHEVLDAVRATTAWTHEGIPLSGAHAVNAVLGEIMPISLGGMHHSNAREIPLEDQELLRRIEDATYELTWNACRYARDLAVVEVWTRRYCLLIRATALNRLERLQSPFLDNARHCQKICKEERNGRAFPEGWKMLEDAINEALDLPEPPRRGKKRV